MHTASRRVLPGASLRGRARRRLADQGKTIGGMGEIFIAPENYFQDNDKNRLKR
jgi:hypothetical protein